MLARENPFRVERVLRVRYRFPDGKPGWDALLARLETLSRRGAIVGGEGRGKTTLLEDLGERLAGRGNRVLLCRVTAERRRVELERASGAFVLIDGADLLSPLRWLRVLWIARRAAGLVVTARSEGLLPTLYRPETSPQLLSRIAAALDGGLPSPEDLFQRHRGNLRTALRELYDLAGVRAPAGTGAPPC